MLSLKGLVADMATQPSLLDDLGFFPVVRYTSVDLVSVYEFYQLGSDVHNLTKIDDSTTDGTIYLMMFQANMALYAFGRNALAAKRFPDTLKAASRVSELIEGLMPGFANLSDIIPVLRIKLRDDVIKFEQSLDQESQKLHSYVLNNGKLLSHDVLGKLSESFPSSQLLDDWTVKQIDAAGKCLACWCCTASGFHILRAVELCLKAYLDVFNPTAFQAKNRNWKSYIDWLRGAGAPSELIDAMSFLHNKRNPLMHPEDELSPEEAEDLILAARLVVGILILDVESKGRQQDFKTALPKVRSI